MSPKVGGPEIDAHGSGRLGVGDGVASSFSPAAKPDRPGVERAGRTGRRAHQARGDAVRPRSQHAIRRPLSRPANCVRRFAASVHGGHAAPRCGSLRLQPPPPPADGRRESQRMVRYIGGTSSIRPMGPLAEEERDRAAFLEQAIGRITPEERRYYRESVPESGERDRRNSLSRGKRALSIQATRRIPRAAAGLGRARPPPAGRRTEDDDVMRVCAVHGRQE